MDIIVSPRKLLILLLLMIGILLSANIMSIVVFHGFDHTPASMAFVAIFNFDYEKNVPTLFSSLQLIVVGLILSIIGVKQKSNREIYVPWLALAVIFLFLAIDETAELHERLTTLTRDAVDPIRLTGSLFFAWVIPYGLGVLVLVIALSNFLLRLPRKTALLFTASGAIYITGAIGFEMLGAGYFESYSSGRAIYSVFYTCEELLEMLGVSLFIYALLAYISNEFQYVKFTIKD